jgi:cobalt-precorrin-5B (C1)-methyltransferase
MNVVARVAAERRFNSHLVQKLEQANTVEAAIEILKAESSFEKEELRGISESQKLWIDIEQRIAALAQSRVPAVKKVKVRLFNLQGESLGAD